MPQNSSNYFKIPQNAPKYVLQDYRGISWRANLPPTPEALLMSETILRLPSGRVISVVYPVGNVSMERTAREKWGVDTFSIGASFASGVCCMII